MPWGINATVLTLIPKKMDAETMREYRPISCCNLIYKIISKIITNRLQAIIPEAVEPNQSTFIKDRLMLENALLATELVKNYHRNSAKTRCALKIDISKAFDTVRWDFIIAILQAMAIPDLFIYWIKSCISAASFSVSINGEVDGFFSSSRGLRQGCLLSPYLFDIVNNVLSLLLNKAAHEGKIGYHPLCKEIGLTHLSFSDDILIFLDGQPDSLNGVMEVLETFGLISGLKINADKSTLYLGGSVSDILLRTSSTFGFPIGQLPVRYLGLPLTTKRMTRGDYEPFIDKIRTRFLSWANKMLS